MILHGLFLTTHPKKPLPKKSPFTMKNPSPSLFVFCLALMSPLATAQAVNLIENGTFEAGPGQASAVQFISTPGWYNWGQGLNQRANARSDANPLPGSRYSAVINDRYNFEAGPSLFSRAQFGPLVHTQKTGHVIRAGESFQVSYEWAGAYRWNLTRNEVRFVLFATNTDTLGGEVVWSEVFDSGVHAGREGAWKKVSHTGRVVNPAAVGRTLFVAFFGVQDGTSLSAQPGFARVDNLEVKVR